MKKTNNIFFRCDDALYNRLMFIKSFYNFRSVSELCHTIVLVFSKIYNSRISSETNEEMIEEMFNEFKECDTFEYEKRKRRIKGVTMSDFENVL